MSEPILRIQSTAMPPRGAVLIQSPLFRGVVYPASYVKSRRQKGTAVQQNRIVCGAVDRGIL